MRKAGILASVFVIGLLALAASPYLQGNYPHVKLRVPAGPTVKILLENGHGSGVHIGGGVILTAAHVTVGQTEVMVRIPGVEIDLPADVLWGVKNSDVSLVRLRGGVTRFRSARLECRESPVGEAVRIEGSPHGFEFISTWWFIGSRPFKLEGWHLVQVVNVVASNGVSGGPVYNRNEMIVGILVGGQQKPVSMFMAVPTGYNIIVPATEICALLGRAT